MNKLNERIVELIQADVDGLLDEFDRAELDAALEESADARIFRQEMLQLTNILAAIPDLDPPAELHRRILDSIELPSARQLPIWLTGWFRPISYGMAVFAGMVIMVGVVNFVPFNDDEMTSLVGAMVHQGEGLPSSSQGQLGVDLEAVRGSVLLKKLDGAMALQFEIFSAEPVEIGLDLAESGLKFVGFAHETEGVIAIEVSGGNVQVSNQGSHQFVVFLRQPQGLETGVKNLQVSISQNELRIFKGSIAFGG